MTVCCNGLSSCIERVPIFNHLDTKDKELISQKVINKKYKKGEYIYRAADKTDVLFIVNSGAVRIYRIAKSGKEQLVRVLGPGDFMGEWSIFNPGEYLQNYAQAIEDSSICMIYQDDLQEFLLEYPEISLKLLSEMSKRLSQSENQTMTLSTDPVGSRLARYIIDLAPADQRKNITVVMPLMRKDIASLLGTTPETISRKFKELEDLGLIEQHTPSKINIPDIEKLFKYN